jgi:tetratricopeptide (TPR) repeat protein
MGLSSGQFYLGLVQESAGNVDLAMACYTQARQGFTRLENLPASVEALAGQARLYLAQGDLAEAQNLASQVLEHLEKHSPQGMELPLLAYQSCASVFQSAGDLPRARHAAELGQIELLRRAARISDPAWRQVYLEAAPEHNQLSILLSPG